MTLSVSISPDAEAKLREQAATHGTDVAQYARQLIERGVGASNGAPSQTSEQNRLSALNRFVDRIRQKSAQFPQGYVVDDSRESIYEGRGE